MARGSQSYEGRVPAARGTGPRNLAKTPAAATPVRSPSVRGSVASTPSVRPGLASAGYNPPAGAGSGIAKATSPMASAPRKVINRPKTGKPTNSRRLGTPRADGPGKI